MTPGVSCVLTSSGVPDAWPLCRLGYVARIGNGSTPTAGEESLWSDDGFPWLNSSKINDRDVTAAEKFVTPKALRDCHLPRVPAGSVLVAITGEGQTRGRTAILRIPATISQHLAFVDVDRGRLEPEYVRRYFEAAYDWLRLESSGVGSTRAALTCEYLRNCTIPTPPLPAQRAIANFLDKKTAAIDALIGQKEHLIELLQEKQQALIEACFPWHYERAADRADAVRLDQLIQERARPLSPQKDTWYTEIGVRSHGRGIFHKEPIRGIDLGDKNVFWVTPGNLIFNIVFAWEGAVALVGDRDDGLIASHRFPSFFARSDSVYLPWLLEFFRSFEGKRLLELHSPGAAGRNKTLDRRSLLKEKIIVPPVDAQLATVRRIQAESSADARLVQKLAEQVESVREYRQALISAAVTGKLDVTKERAA